jgi:hypothetical protein
VKITDIRPLNYRRKERCKTIFAQPRPFSDFGGISTRLWAGNSVWLHLHVAQEHQRDITILTVCKEGCSALPPSKIAARKDRKIARLDDCRCPSAVRICLGWQQPLNFSLAANTPERY